MAESGGLRCDPGRAGSEVDGGSEIEVDELDPDSKGILNNEEWKTVRKNSKKRKQRESDGERGEEEQRLERKIILRFQSPCTLNPLKIQLLSPRFPESCSPYRAALNPVPRFYRAAGGRGAGAAEGTELFTLCLHYLTHITCSGIFYIIHLLLPKDDIFI
ncbi:hypothetical protein AMEX_G18343 [Astyanax mexicanus]|uniref:Uncharacterized protein n=1 Tax=Astyanax mexicanus TaxID=7994 RepID=A0A8T2LDT3_ASTMX|nr:hypothetical protein AMEX_G18343 [Astyanax mexicanus]